MIDFTTFIVVDKEHLRELKVVWPTWATYRPEILRQPLLVAYDAVSVRKNELDFLQHADVKFFPWDYNAPTQRAKMLAAFILLPNLIKTPWYLKLDTDCFAERADPGWCSSLFIKDNPVFVASPWSYTKPATAIQQLDDWGDHQSELSSFPRLNLVFEANSKLVKTPGRIISWCFFGNTGWCQQQAHLFSRGGMPPIYSHDTYLWYVALRTKRFYRTVRMKNFGWSHRKV